MLRRYKEPKLVSAVGSILLLIACNNSNFAGDQSATQAPAAKAAFDSGTSHAEADTDLFDSSLPLVSDSVSLSKGIDLIIALDASGSMLEEKVAIEANLSNLMQVLLKGDLDPQIHFMLGPNAAGKPDFSFPSDIDASRIAVVGQKIGSNNALSHVARLLSGSYANRYFDIKGVPLAKAPAFRTDVQLEVLVISDDDGKNQGGAGSFSNLAKDFDPSNRWKATISGIVGLESSTQKEGVCELASVGREYISLAARSGGSLLDICSSDWSTLILRFSDALVKRSGSMLLSKRPFDATKIEIKLDGKVLPADSWTWHAIENRVYLSKAVPYKSGMLLEASYNVQAQPSL